MKRSRPTDLGASITRFFEDYLPGQRGMSAHTIRSYRDAVVLMLQFTARDSGHGVEQLGVKDFTAERVLTFLKSLETDRHNGIATRNARLGALHVLARFLASERPEHLATLQRVINLPFKRGARDAPIEYPDGAEMDALLKSIDRTRPTGQRDYALFALMFNTGARVQEVLNLRRRDLRLDAPCQVRLLGKGNKVRLCPLWPATAKLLRDFVDPHQVPGVDPLDAFLFTNARGQQLTRFGVRYLLRKHVAAATRMAPTLRGKRLHPHSLRHGTAIALLKSGVDFATISQWLGHASLNTTMRYARADIDLKRQALSQVFPHALPPPKGGRLMINGSELIPWLRRL
ncbi:MAG: tyrosine-type recombinase/integrase [Steroidobacteraceae bacterium]